MKAVVFRTAAALLATVLWAGDKWMEKDYRSWSGSQAQQMLNDSPWARLAGAEIVLPKEDPSTKDIPLPRSANVPNPGPSYQGDAYGVDDGNWDGGVMGRAKRGDPPKIPVLIRWDSARPVRQALLKTHAPELGDTEHTLGDEEKDYVITVQGLAPVRKAPNPDADDEDNKSIAAPFDAKSIRLAFFGSARLTRAGKKPIEPEDVHLDETSGTVQIYFPKSDPITLDDKTVVFHARYGTLRVAQGFRLKDMVVKGRLEL
jgi:hypothetical protein